MKVRFLSYDQINQRLIAILADDVGERIQIDYVGGDLIELHRKLSDARDQGHNVVPDFQVIKPKTPKGKKKIVDMGGTAACHGGIK